jgi:hypothetical protein
VSLCTQSVRDYIVVCLPVCTNTDSFSENCLLPTRFSCMMSWHGGLPRRTLTASLFQTPAKATTLRRRDIEVIGEFTCSEPQLACIRFTLSTFCWGEVVSPIISLTVPSDLRSGKSYLEDSTVDIAEDGCIELDILRILLGVLVRGDSP